MICILTAAGAIALAADRFTLSWTHSVAKTRWVEDWVVSAEGLRPVEAEIQGPGAGMELPETAWRVPEGWRYRVDLPPQKRVYLAASGETPDPWRLCTADGCHLLGADAAQPVEIALGACPSKLSQINHTD